MTYFHNIRNAQVKTDVTSLNHPMQEFGDL